LDQRPTHFLLVASIEGQSDAGALLTWSAVPIRFQFASAEDHSVLLRYMYFAELDTH
jgi:hypothetical protein